MNGIVCSTPTGIAERSVSVKPRVLILNALAIGLAAAPASAQEAANSAGQRVPFPGAVYTMSNAVSGNSIIMFDRLPDGQLVAAGQVSTGGTGTGGGLGNQGGLTLTRSERWLLAVNAGSDTVSVLEVRNRGLRLRDVEPTGGTQPVSVTEHRGLVYVLNAGSDSITGFVLDRHGRLHSLAGSTRSLSGAAPDPHRSLSRPTAMCWW